MQKCKRVDLYGFGLTEKHGVRHHYFNRNTTVKGVEKGVDGLDKEFESLLDLADAELIWIADPCLDGEDSTVQYGTVLFCAVLHQC